MSLFGNKLEAALARNGALLALLAKVGLDAAEGDALPTPEAFAAAQAASAKTATDAAVAAALAPVNASLAVSAAKLVAFTDGLLAGGVKLDATKFATAESLTAEEKKDKTPEQLAALVASKNSALVAEAVKAAVGAKAAAVVTTAAHPQALPSDPATAAAGEPTTVAELTTALSAEKDPVKKWSLFKKLQAAEAKAAKSAA